MLFSTLENGTREAFSAPLIGTPSCLVRIFQSRKRNSYRGQQVPARIPSLAEMHKFVTSNLFRTPLDHDYQRV